MPTLLSTRQKCLCLHKTKFQVLLCVREPLHEAPGLECQLKSALAIPISIHNHPTEKAAVSVPCQSPEVLELDMPIFPTVHSCSWLVDKEGGQGMACISATYRGTGTAQGTALYWRMHSETKKHVFWVAAGWYKGNMVPYLLLPWNPCSGLWKEIRAWP